MTKERMEAYYSMREEIKEITDKLDCTDTFIGNDVINDYRSGYARPQSVVGIDFKKMARYENRLEKLKKECADIEEYIECIPDSMTRRIFRMYFLENISQTQIANKIHTDQSTVSRRIKEYLKNC